VAGARSAVFACAIAIVLAASRTASAQDVEKIEDTTTPPNKEGDDIVETIEDQPQATKPEPKPPEPKKEEPKPDKFEFRGFTRLTVAAGTITPYVAPEFAPAAERVGYDRGSIMQHGYVDFRYSRGKSFQAVLSGSLAYGAYLNESRPGPVQPENNVEFGRIEPVLREAYIGVYSGRFDLRLGQQRIVWGNSDGIAPNDILNARDLRNRMQLDTEMIHLPTLAARADIDLGLAVLGLVAQPFFVPDQFSLYGGNWSLVQPDAPRTYRRLFGLYAAGRDRTVVEDVQQALVTARVPKSVVKAGSFGGSLRFNFGKVDAAYYYYYGFDRTPFVYLDPQFAAQLDQFDPNAVNGAILDVFLQQLNSASASYGGPLVINYYRRHHVGADAATTVGPFVLRVDTAYDSAASFFAKDTLNSVARPQAQGVFGIEYQTGDLNKIILLETWYMRLLGPEVPLVPVLSQANDGPLLFVKEDNLGFSNLVRWTFFENLIVETRSFLGATPFWYMVRPEIGYVNTSFTARVGALLIEGRDDSFGRYYRRNNTVYVTARYAF
jgi:hypothetical protein